MQCPNCQTTLLMSERQGIEIDYCPQCRGVWLDRGELDKLIERSSREAEPAPQAVPQAGRPTSAAPDRDERYRDERHAGHGDYRHKKKKSVWDEIFDF